MIKLEENRTPSQRMGLERKSSQIQALPCSRMSDKLENKSGRLSQGKHDGRSMPILNGLYIRKCDPMRLKHIFQTSTRDNVLAEYKTQGASDPNKLKDSHNIYKFSKKLMKKQSESNVRLIPSKTISAGIRGSVSCERRKTTKGKVSKNASKVKVKGIEGYYVTNPIFPTYFAPAYPNQINQDLTGGELSRRETKSAFAGAHKLNLDGTQINRKRIEINLSKNLPSAEASDCGDKLQENMDKLIDILNMDPQKDFQPLKNYKSEYIEGIEYQTVDPHGYQNLMGNLDENFESSFQQNVMKEYDSHLMRIPRQQKEIPNIQNFEELYSRRKNRRENIINNFGGVNERKRAVPFINFNKIIGERVEKNYGISLTARGVTTEMNMKRDKYRERNIESGNIRKREWPSDRSSSEELTKRLERYLHFQSQRDKRPKTLISQIDLGGAKSVINMEQDIGMGNTGDDNMNMNMNMNRNKNRNVNVNMNMNMNMNIFGGSLKLRRVRSCKRHSEGRIGVLKYKCNEVGSRVRHTRTGLISPFVRYKEKEGAQWKDRTLRGTKHIQGIHVDGYNLPLTRTLDPKP